MGTSGAENTICLVDGSGYIFRAFYALPNMTRADGTPVNAVYGFLKMLMQLIQEQQCAHIVVVFDAARRNFRNNIYPAYKQTRKEVPADLIPQFPLIREACHMLNVPQIEMEGYEADDLIATYARIAYEKGWSARIISADKDLMQLIQERVQLYDPMKHKMIALDDVIAKFGVTPDKVVDVQALMGDRIDNVPGAIGIGPKTASEIINQFGSIEEVYHHLDEIKNDKRREGLKRDKEQVFISKQLVQLDKHVPVSDDLIQFKVKAPNEESLITFLNKNNFKSLSSKIQIWLKKQSAFLETHQDALPLFAQPNEETKIVPEINLSDKTDTPTYHLIQNLSDWAKMTHQIQTHQEFAFQCFICQHSLTGVSFMIKEKTYYVPLSETTAFEPDLFSVTASIGIDVDTFMRSMFNWLSDKNIHKIAYDLKKQLHILTKIRMKEPKITNYDDILIQNYVLNGTTQSVSLSEIAQKELDIKSTTEKLQKEKTITDFSIEQQAQIATEEVFSIFELYKHFYQQLEKENLSFIYRSVDLPLIPILFQMEEKGILIDKSHLEILNEKFTQEINQTVNQIYECAGMVFNVNSPNQIATVLFEKMGLSKGKKNGSGSFSTNVKVLEKLAEEGVEIASLILKYRLFSKLKSTYIDALLKSADKNERIHTTFLQTITNTGRLSSVDPNLQNIPIRTNAGKEIRKAFIARKGYKIVCADYSQIELRLMADVAHVTQLKESFIQNEDIHARTASQVFKIPLQQIDSDTRRKAKAINFGIVYGISPFGLSAQLGISQKDAKNYINSYFEHYPEIKTYMKETETFVKENGYVKTPLGRICYIAGVENPKTRSFALRAAINAPIQGGAADIIKLAMKNIQQELSAHQWEASLLLQVHDELVFEVKEEDVPDVMRMVKTQMENAVQLSIPLIADVRMADNWKEAH